MKHEEAIAILAADKGALQGFHVKSLAIFGSVARNEATETSDVDILVEFDTPVGLFTFLGLQQHLEELLGRRVDLATADALRERMREQVLREAVHAA